MADNLLLEKIMITQIDSHLKTIHEALFNYLISNKINNVSKMIVSDIKMGLTGVILDYNIKYTCIDTPDNKFYNTINIIEFLKLIGIYRYIEVFTMFGDKEDSFNIQIINIWKKVLAINYENLVTSTKQENKICYLIHQDPISRLEHKWEIIHQVDGFRSQNLYSVSTTHMSGVDVEYMQKCNMYNNYYNNIVLQYNLQYLFHKKKYAYKINHNIMNIINILTGETKVKYSSNKQLFDEYIEKIIINRFNLFTNKYDHPIILKIIQKGIYSGLLPSLNNMLGSVFIEHIWRIILFYHIKKMKDILIEDKLDNNIICGVILSNFSFLDGDIKINKPEDFYDYYYKNNNLMQILILFQTLDKKIYDKILYDTDMNKYIICNKNKKYIMEDNILNTFHSCKYTKIQRT